MFKHGLTLSSRQKKRLIRWLGAVVFILLFCLTPLLSYSFRLLNLYSRDDISNTEKWRAVKANTVWYWLSLTGPPSDQNMINWLHKNRAAMERQAELYLTQGFCTDQKAECGQLESQTGLTVSTYTGTMLYRDHSVNLGSLKRDGVWKNCFKPCAELIFRSYSRTPHFWWRDLSSIDSWSKHYVYITNVSSMLSEFKFQNGYPKGYLAEKHSRCSVHKTLDHPPSQTQYRRINIYFEHCALRHVEEGWFIALHAVMQP